MKKINGLMSVHIWWMCNWGGKVGIDGSGENGRLTNWPSIIFAENVFDIVLMPFNFTCFS
jgi:hypothetical protein